MLLPRCRMTGDLELLLAKVIGKGVGGVCLDSKVQYLSDQCKSARKVHRRQGSITGDS